MGLKQSIEVAKRYGTYAIPALTTMAHSVATENKDTLALTLTGVVASAVVGVLSEVRIMKERDRGDDWKNTAQKNHVRLSNETKFSFSLDSE